MRPRLAIFRDTIGHYLIAWDDEGYPGLELGDKPRAVDEEHKVATDAAVLVGGPDLLRRKSDRVLLFETQGQATKALRAARAAVRNMKNPMPDWAVKASSEGWKPPKNWKPQP